MDKPPKLVQVYHVGCNRRLPGSGTERDTGWVGQGGRQEGRPTSKGRGGRRQEVRRREEKLRQVTAGCDSKGLGICASGRNHHHPQAKPLHIRAEIQLFAKVNFLEQNPS